MVLSKKSWDAKQRILIMSLEENKAAPHSSMRVSSGKNGMRSCPYRLILGKLMPSPFVFAFVDYGGNRAIIFVILLNRLLLLCPS
jgi:hypothetical protein